MKKFLLLAALICGSLNALADDVKVTISGTLEGGTGLMNLYISGVTEKYTACQMDIYLPTGMTLTTTKVGRVSWNFAPDTDENTGSLVDHSVGNNQQEDGCWRILVSSNTAQWLYDGRMCYFTVLTDDSYTGGDIVVKGAQFSASGSGPSLDEISSTAVNVKVGECGFSTLALPFDATLPDAVSAYSVKIDGTNAVLSGKASAVSANVPVILSTVDDATVSEDGGSAYDNKCYVYGVANATDAKNGELVGVYEATPITSGYVLVNVDGTPKFQEVTTTATMPAYKAYLNTTASIKGIVFDDATGINSVENAEGVESIYNVNGTRLSKVQKGVNIIKRANGEVVKVLVK